LPSFVFNDLDPQFSATVSHFVILSSTRRRSRDFEPGADRERPAAVPEHQELGRTKPLAPGAIALYSEMQGT